MYFFFILKREKVHFEALWPTAASLTLLWLTSSTLLHFGKTSKLAFHSAFATSGIESELPLLSLCATFKFQGARSCGPRRADLRVGCYCFKFDSLYFIYFICARSLRHKFQVAYGTGFNGLTAVSSFKNSQFSILNSQFSILNSQFSIFNSLLGVSG